MPSQAFVDFDALTAIVQANAGGLVSVQWGTTPDPFQGFAGLDGNGNPLPGMPSAPPALDPAASGSACKVTLDVTSISPVGVDDTRRDFIPGEGGAPGHVQLTQYGLRHFTLTMRVESDTYPSSQTVAERMRTRWLRRSTTEALHAIGCALRRVGDCRSMSVPAWDNRTIDACTLEVFLAYAVEEVDTVGETGSEHPGNWIESVQPLTFIKG